MFMNVDIMSSVHVIDKFTPCVPGFVTNLTSLPIFNRDFFMNILDVCFENTGSVERLATFRTCHLYYNINQPQTSQPISEIVLKEFI